MNKHYIRINENLEIIKSLSNAPEFEPILDTDIFIEDGGRHYNLSLMNENGQYKFKYINGSFVEITEFPIIETPITSEERLQAVEQATQDIIMMTLGGM